MNKEKICFKSDGTKETGVKIIKALEELKGRNPYSNRGTDKDSYYYIATSNIIEADNSIPKDYTLKDIHTWNNTPSKEKLLEEAKKRYSNGTKFKDPTDGKEYTITDIDSCLTNDWLQEDYLIVLTEETKPNGAYLYYRGKWAEIVSLPENNIPSKDKPFYVVVTEENKEVLSKWRDVDLYVGQIVGLSNLLSINCDRSHNDTPTENFGNKITFEQFLDLYPECKEDDKPKYKIGSWYKSCVGKNTYYFKVIDIKNQSFSELKVNFVDRCSTYRDAHSISYNSPIDDNAILLTDLSEIQQYLPDGHVDKIVEKKSLIGRYLKALVARPQYTDFAAGTYIKIVGDSHNGNYDVTLEGSMKYEATIGHRDWKLMPEGFTPENIVPEYVECIGKMYSFKIGGIYKTEPYPLGGYRVLADDYGGQTIEGYENCFKPSTKEAYEAFKKGVKIVEEFVLPEKWCIVRTPENCDTINKWFSNRHTSKFSANGVWFNSMQKDYMHFPFIGQKVYQHKIEEGYTEITFEQFKKYVLEEKDEFVYAPDGSFKEEMPKYMTTLPKYKAGESTWIKPDWQIEREQMLLQNARRVITDKQAGFNVTPEMFHPIQPQECFQKEVTLYKKSKSKLFSTFVGEVKEVKIPLTKVKTSKLITNK